MTVVAARVDERMIHGQVATVWTNTVGADRLMVANDKVVHDDLQISALKMARPAGKKLAISSIEKAIINLQPGAKYTNDKVFVITRNIADMAALIDGGAPITNFNVGNISEKEGSKAIKKSVNLTPDDVATINRLLDQGIKITAQMVPNESDASIATFLEEK
ncbi:PTS sugar transporter subunit IIB [Lactobacillus sp. ESL0684]|uniref:PTS system mannose/fructose/N-acetylgalactosamine-transporter subunit IIB n=1 Tax=unclassified Lactobacillus TaxID=2620435 RepID=UPI0023F6A27E|nr:MULTISPECIES: PTS sugar transporter subunit IIB [unclassified Lactobacillus]WEV41179.1 PTS sugar transporter subunit IIB [Lactobacillus sp. ESL0681]WEV43997.1 PTS sugar transporter subunit IIB [Lactobacillus sp. ESL0684]